MKPRAQSSILLLVTLVIGILLGALLQSSIRSNRMSHMRFLHDEEQFITQLETSIDPVSNEQAAQVHAILVEVSPEIMGTIQQHREAVRLQFTMLESRLQPVLDEEQQERLKRRLQVCGQPVEINLIIILYILISYSTVFIVSP